MKEKNKAWFKVDGHRPFDNDCLSSNVIYAESAESAKKSMTDFYGYREVNGVMKPNVIIDFVSQMTTSNLK